MLKEQEPEFIIATTILTAEVEAYMKQVLQEIAEEKGFEIAMVEVGEHNFLN